MGEQGRALLSTVRDGGKRFISNDGFVYSASISFNVMLAVVPFLFFLILLVSLFIPEVASDSEEIRELIERFFPFSSGFILDNIRVLYKGRGALGVIGLVTLFMTTFSLTNTIHVSLAAMLTDGQGKKFLRTFVSHAVAIIFLPILLLVVFSASSLISLITRVASHIEIQFFRFIFSETILIIHRAIPLFLFLIVSTLVYRHLSPIHIPRKLAIAGGGIFTLSAYLLNKAVIIYLSKISKLSLIYGSIFGVICFIIATYLFAAFFLFTACIIGEHLNEKITG